MFFSNDSRNSCKSFSIDRLTLRVLSQALYWPITTSSPVPDKATCIAGFLKSQPSVFWYGLGGIPARCKPRRLICMYHHISSSRKAMIRWCESMAPQKTMTNPNSADLLHRSMPASLKMAGKKRLLSRRVPPYLYISAR